MVSTMDQNIVPQQPGIPHRLNSIEKQELELARRRAEKAAEGKRANAAAARARRRATRPRLDERTGDAEAEGDASHGEEDDLEAKLAATKDEKEAKRLRRWAIGHFLNHVMFKLMLFPNHIPFDLGAKYCVHNMHFGALDVGHMCDARCLCLLHCAGCCATEFLHSRPERGRRAMSATWRPRPSSQSSWCVPILWFLMVWQVGES